jgi:phosphoglycolate phosphatase
VRLLFDLDGTLTDPGCGITRCLQHALAGLGRVAPPAEDLGWCIGPPLRESLGHLLGSSDESSIDQALALYRERFVAVGMYENTVYPGVRDGLMRLAEAGHRSWVVTSKPHVYARAILAHFGLLGMFVAVHGSELSGERADKVSLLRHVLDVEAWDTQPHVVGDRRHDIEGAHANGLRAIGVLWGYGSRAELEAAGADALVSTMADLVEWIESRTGPTAPPSLPPAWRRAPPRRR